MSQQFEVQVNGRWERIDINPTKENMVWLQGNLYGLIKDHIFGWLAMCNPADFYLPPRPRNGYRFEKIVEIYEKVSLLGAISFFLSYSPHNIPDPVGSNGIFFR